MGVFVAIGVVAALCVIVILSAVPELLAATLTAVAVLGVYYQFQPTERQYSMTQTAPETSAEQPGALVVTRNTDPDSGAVTYSVETPVPEYIQVQQASWDDWVATGQDWYILIQEAGAEPDDPAVWVFNINLPNAAYRYRQVESPVADAGPVFHLEFQTSW